MQESDIFLAQRHNESLTAQPKLAGYCTETSQTVWYERMENNEVMDLNCVVALVEISHIILLILYFSGC
jgi:hypothetical protein